MFSSPSSFETPPAAAPQDEGEENDLHSITLQGGGLIYGL